MTCMHNYINILCQYMVYTFVIFIHISLKGSGSGRGLLHTFIPSNLHMASCASTTSGQFSGGMSLRTSNSHTRTMSTCDGDSDLWFMTSIIKPADVYVMRYASHLYIALQYSICIHMNTCPLLHGQCLNFFFPPKSLLQLLWFSEGSSVTSWSSTGKKIAYTTDVKMLESAVNPAILQQNHSGQNTTIIVPLAIVGNCYRLQL